MESELSREERRSLAIHRAVAAAIRAEPHRHIPVVKDNIARLMQAHRHSPEVVSDLERWLDLLNGPVEELCHVLAEDLSAGACALRQNTPFARILGHTQRWDVIRQFRSEDERRASAS